MSYRTIFILVAFFPSSLLGQTKDSSNTKESIEIIVDTEFRKKRVAETSRVSLNDSAALMMPIQTDSVKVILLQAKEDGDGLFYKYWFPLLTLLIGSALTFLSEFVRAWFTTRKVGRRWIGQSKLYLHVIEKQEKLIEEFLDTEDVNKWGITALNRAVHIDGEQFNAFSEEQLLDFFEKHKSLAADEALLLTSRYSGSLKSLRWNYKQLDDAYRTYSTAISRHSSDATNILRNIGVALAEWTAVILQREPQIKGEKEACDKAAVLYETEITLKKQEDGWNIFELEQKVYDPMIEILAEGFQIPEVYNVLKVLEVAKHAVQIVKAEKSYMKEGAQTLLDRYKEYRIELQDLINQADSSSKKKYPVSL